jgi:hypothetical protein
LCVYLTVSYKLSKSRNSSVGIVTELRAGRSGFKGSIPGRDWEFFSSAPCLDLSEAHPASYPVGKLGALSPGVERPGREADHSPPSSADVKNSWSCTSTPPIRLHGVVLN